MRTRVLTAFIILLIACGAAQGATGKEFCESFITLTGEAKESKIPTSLTWKIILRPKKIIKASFIGEEDGVKDSQKNTSKDSKYIFVHLPLPLVDMKALETLKNREAEIAHLPIISELRNVKDVNSCLEVVKNNPNDFEQMSDYINEYNRNLDVLNDKKEAQSTNILLKKLKRFSKKGWRIVLSSDLFEMYKILEKTKSITQIMLVSHSDELGRIYDAKKNIFPKGAFSNLPGNIKKVIMYSCHSRQVLDFYEIKKLTNKIDYYFPEIQEEFKEVYSTKIPVVAVKGMLTVAEAGMRNNLKSDRQCSVLIDFPVVKDNVVVSLNDQFVGSLSPNTQIDCGLISENSNTIKVFYLGSAKREPLQISAIKIITSSRATLVAITKEFISKNRENHLLTIGTFGGKL
jgi:hypothetical protein